MMRIVERYYYPYFILLSKYLYEIGGSDPVIGRALRDRANPDSIHQGY